MDEESVQQLYAWIDEIVLSRPKRNITRDFSDGVLAAEIVAHFVPSIVELHNYTPANNSQQKRTNWDTLNRKVFKRIDFNVPSNIVNGIVMCKAGVIEIVLFNLRVKILNYKKAEEESESDYNGLNAEPEPWNGVQNPYYTNTMGVPIGGANMGPQNMGHQNMGAYPPVQMFQPQHHPSAPVQPQNHFRHNFKQGHIQNNANGAMLPIPFEGEQVKKKKSSKKKKIPSQSPSKHAGSERSRSMPSTMFTHLDHESRIYIQEKEQALLQSQETIQILQSKISRLEHLLQLKDLRIEDLDMKLKSTVGGARAMR